MREDVTEAVAILDRIIGCGATARALGGVGVALRCPSTAEGQPLTRVYGDLDIATDRKSVRDVVRVVTETGYDPAQRFNAAHGRTRLLFYGPTGRHLDVFVDTFTMCHTLDLRPRLTLHSHTLPLADLLLTKLQIAELNHKDVVDIAALLVDHELATDETGINQGYVATVLSRDWGWWRTVTENVALVTEQSRTLGLPRGAHDRLGERAKLLLKAIDDHAKSIKWRARASLGDRMPWRDEPEQLDA